MHRFPVITFRATGGHFGCGQSHLPEQPLKEKPDASLTGLSLARWSTNPEFLPGTLQNFLDQLASRDERNAAGPVTKEEHPANTASSAHALEEFAPVERREPGGAGPGIVSDRSRTWKNKQQKVACSRLRHVGGLFLCMEKVFGGSLRHFSCLF